MEKVVCEQRLKITFRVRTKAVDAFSAPPGDELLVSRENSKTLEGPFVLYKYDNYKTAYVDINSSIKPFSTASVKMYLRTPKIPRIRKRANQTLPPAKMLQCLHQITMLSLAKRTTWLPLLASLPTALDLPYPPLVSSRTPFSATQHPMLQKPTRPSMIPSITFVNALVESMSWPLLPWPRFMLSSSRIRPTPVSPKLTSPRSKIC